MIDSFWIDGERLSAAAQKATADWATGVHRWTEAMSATGRRQATSVAASKLRQWVNRTLEDRPTRGELRAWIELVLDERRGLHNKAEGLAKENDAVDDQRDTLVEALAAMKVERDALTAQRDDALKEVARVRRARDEALESYREDVEHFRAHVETLDADRTRRTRERDEAVEELARYAQRVGERMSNQVNAYEELRQAYEAAEGERNELARESAERVRVQLGGGRGAGRASCPHTPGGGAK